MANASILLALLVLFTSIAHCLPHRATTTTSTLPTLPLSSISASNTGALALPTPASSPVVIALGVGTQNYTCNSTGSWVQAGSGTGAIASLFNATSYLSQHPEQVSQLPQTYLTQFNRQCGAFTSCPNDDLRCEQRVNNALDNFATLGEHYFNAQSMPTFDLFDATPTPLFLNAVKKGDIKSPTVGAVDWLYLAYNGTGISEGLTSVYRVETAGGVAPSSCSYGGTSPQITSIPYAAEYWFYD